MTVELSCYVVSCRVVQLFALSEHLCNWGLAEVICTISSKSIYQARSLSGSSATCMTCRDFSLPVSRPAPLHSQVHPHFDLSVEEARNSNIENLKKSFSSSFGGLDLYQALSLFTGSRTLQEVVQRLPE